MLPPIAPSSCPALRPVLRLAVVGAAHSDARVQTAMALPPAELIASARVLCVRCAQFALQDIGAMQELSFDYGETTGGKHGVCRCGAANCRGKFQ